MFNIVPKVGEKFSHSDKMLVVHYYNFPPKILWKYDPKLFLRIGKNSKFYRKGLCIPIQNRHGYKSVISKNNFFLCRKFFCTVFFITVGLMN